MKKYEYKESEKKLLEAALVPFAVYQFIDNHVKTIVLSKGFLNLFGYEEKEKAYYDMDNNMYLDTHPDDIARIEDAAISFAKEDKEYNVVYRSRDHLKSGYKIIHAIGKHIIKEDGTKLAQVSYTDEGAFLGDEQGNIYSLNSTLSSALNEESLIKNNYYDYLTGLPSMTYFFMLAEQGRNNLLKQNQKPIILFLDMSGMNNYNREYGFVEGDKLIIEFSKLLASYFGLENCSRVGQDHFTVYTVQEGIEEKLKKLFEETKTLNNNKSLPVRVGIYQNSMETVIASVACDRAKKACNTLRETYVSNFKYFDDKMRSEQVEKQYIIDNIDKAIENGWINVYYQPIIRTVSGRVCDEEGLARWIDPVKGLISPAIFVPVLESVKMIYKLDLCIVEQVLQKLKIQAEHDLFIVPQSVNISKLDFESCDMVEEIRKRVDDAGIPHDKINIEITESAVGKDFEFIKSQIERFQKLGFSVWLDDFGTGYSSLNVLQDIRFDLIKLDMKFMKNFDTNEDSKIVLAELIKMATSLGISTVCEGVETEEQIKFLKEVGCSKLQGFYYQKPIPLEEIIKKYERGIQIGFENPKESSYYETVGILNLYDLSTLAKEDNLGNVYNVIPMCIIEMKDGKTRYLRSNDSYKSFLSNTFHIDYDKSLEEFSDRLEINRPTFYQLLKNCSRTNSRSLADELLDNNTVIHYLARRIAYNEQKGITAFMVGILSILEENEGTSYINIARALSTDFYNLFYINTETNTFIEYSSKVGENQMAVERQGIDFFNESRKDAQDKIYPADREKFFSEFKKTKILHDINAQGSFVLSYRLYIDGIPQYVSMKATKMHNDSKHIIIGVSNIDAQVKERKEIERMRHESINYSRMMSLTGNYVCVYVIDTNTWEYDEYDSSDDYKGLGIEKKGKDFFESSQKNAYPLINPEDLPYFKEKFNKENILKEIKGTGIFTVTYRLRMPDGEKQFIIRAALTKEVDGEKLIVGVFEKE